MYDIHLIEKNAAYYRVEGTSDEWITGSWVLSEDTAEQLIGGTVHLHTAQKAGCYLGGEILGCKLVSPQRYEIHFKLDKSVMNKTANGNWGMEKMLVRRLDAKAS